MTDSRDVRHMVSLVADGLRRRETESVIVETLVAAGVARHDAPAIYRDVKAACQQGVQSVVTDGRSAPDGPPADPLLSEAFRVGQASLRAAVRKYWLQRVVVLLVVAMLLVATLWWLGYRRL